MFRHCALGLVFFGLAYGQATLNSPNESLTMTVNTTAEHHLVYSVTYKGKPLIGESSLQLTLQGARPLGADVTITGQSPVAAKALRATPMLSQRAPAVRSAALRRNALSLAKAF